MRIECGKCGTIYYLGLQNRVATYLTVTRDGQFIVWDMKIPKGVKIV